MPKQRSRLQALLEVLACPKCKGSVVHDRKENKLVCNRCRLRFKVLEGDVPDMLLKDAEEF